MLWNSGAMQNPLITVPRLVALRQRRDITLLDVRFGGREARVAGNST